MAIPAPSELFPLFRSTDMTRLVLELVLTDAEMSFSDLARQAKVVQPSVSRVMPALLRAGVVTTRKAGPTVLVTMNRSAPFYPALRDLLEVTEGPPRVIAQECAAVGGIEELMIFGSWAQRARGVSGHSPRDIDLLVVGDPDRGPLHDALKRSSERLRRAVNPFFVSASEWSSRDSEFLVNLDENPLVLVEHEPRPKAPPPVITDEDLLA